MSGILARVLGRTLAKYIPSIASMKSRKSMSTRALCDMCASSNDVWLFSLEDDSPGPSGLTDLVGRVSCWNGTIEEEDNTLETTQRKSRSIDATMS
jgi:hypothetical protein